jgi:hypothetical protein
MRRLMNDALDVDLQDAELIAEIQLIADLMVVASESSGAVSQRVLDETLGVEYAVKQGFPEQRSVHHPS